MTECRLCLERKRLERESELAIKRGDAQKIGDGGIIWMPCGCDKRKIVRIK